MVLGRGLRAFQSRIVAQSSRLSPEAMDAFVRKETIKMMTAFTVLFVAGVYVCDLCFFSRKQLAGLAESVEEEFWRSRPRPQHIRSELRPCVRAERHGELCETFVRAQLGKDKYVPKTIAEDLERFKNWSERARAPPSTL